MTENLTVVEAAALTGLGLPIIKNAIARKQLPIQPHRLKTPGRKAYSLISKADLMAWLASREATNHERQKQREQSQVVHEARERRRQARAAQNPNSRPGTKPRCSRRSETWGELLRSTRENLRLTITELGRRAEICQSYVSRMEGLGEIPRRDKVLALAKALNVDPNPFLLLCGYPPCELSPLVQLTQSLLAMPPDEALGLLTAWRATPESERRQWMGSEVRPLLAG